jgi:hypothetical protein
MPVLKAQALQHLLVEGRLQLAGYHHFPEGQWAAVLSGEGHTFHRPYPDGAGETSCEIDVIDAKPREAKEPRLKDALYTVRHYLSGKPEVQVYQWPARIRPDQKSEGWELVGADDGFGGADFDDVDEDFDGADFDDED